MCEINLWFRSKWLVQKLAVSPTAVEMYGNVRQFLQVADHIGSPDLSQFTDPWCLLIFLRKHITSQLTGTLQCRRGCRSGQGEGGSFSAARLLRRWTEMSVSGWRSLEIIRSGLRNSSLAEIRTNSPNADVLQKTSENMEISRFIQRHV